MNIYVIRNGLAVTGSDVADEHRHLSAEGRQSARGVGARLRREGVAIDAMITSPLSRSVQTAELIADQIDYLGVIECATCVLPGAQPDVAARRIASLGESVAVVGHEPMISALCALIVNRPGFAPLRHAQVCHFIDDQPAWKLLPHTLEIEILHTA